MIPSAGMRVLEEFYRQQAIDQHEARKKEWPWYGRFQHWLFVSWRCPSCKAVKGRYEQYGDSRE